MMRMFYVLVVAACAACGNPLPAESEGNGTEVTPAKAPVEVAPNSGEAVQPPFQVRGDLRGLLMVWFDKDGLHTASTRDEIPEAHRHAVRIDSLELPPEHRLDAEFVYVADLRKADGTGSYPVRKMPRPAFDALTDLALEKVAQGGGDVVLYKAAWCGACRSAEAYMKSRGIAYTAHDIEKDAAAAAEMQQKVNAAGKVARGVPVIDWKGEIMLGFDKARMQSLIDG